MTAPPLPVPLARQAIDRFLAFQSELVEVKRMAAAMVPDGGEPAEQDPAAAVDPSQPPPAAGPTPIDLFLRLRAAICPTGTPPPAADGVADMGYVMAALADEALLHQVQWPGKSQWMGTLLEYSLYGSRVAGEEVFDLARAIIDGRILGRADLAAAILLALSLGFRGRYSGVNDRGAIDALRRQLYEHVYNRPPPSGSAWQPALPTALQPVLEAERLQRLPRLLPWIAAIVAVLVLTLAASDGIWIGATQPLLDQAAQIMTLRSAAIHGTTPVESSP